MKNAIFEDDFVILLVFSDIFVEKKQFIPRNRHFGTFFMKIAILGDLLIIFLHIFWWNGSEYFRLFVEKLPKDPRKMRNEFFTRLKTRIGFFGDLLVIFGGFLVFLIFYFNYVENGLFLYENKRVLPVHICICVYIISI